MYADEFIFAKNELISQQSLIKIPICLTQMGILI